MARVGRPIRPHLNRRIEWIVGVLDVPDVWFVVCVADRAQGAREGVRRGEIDAARHPPMRAQDERVVLALAAAEDRPVHRVVGIERRRQQH